MTVQGEGEKRKEKSNDSLTERQVTAASETPRANQAEPERRQNTDP